MQPGLYIVCVLMSITVYFACSLSGPADFRQAFTEFCVFLLLLYPKPVTSSEGLWWKVTLHCSKIRWQSRRAEAAAEQGQAEDTENVSAGFLFPAPCSVLVCSAVRILQFFFPLGL